MFIFGEDLKKGLKIINSINGTYFILNILFLNQITEEKKLVDKIIIHKLVHLLNA